MQGTDVTSKLGMRYFRKKTITLSLLLLFAVAVIIYFVLLPLIITNRYADNVRAAGRPLEEDFRALNKSTEFYLVNDQNATETTRKSEAAHSVELVNASLQKINTLKEVNGGFTSSPYFNALGQYHRAQTLQQQTGGFIDQSEAALRGYLDLIAYLDVFHRVTDGVVLELGTFNKVADINIYEGQSGSMRQIANKLRAEAATLAESSPPHDLEALNTAAIAAITKAASGFDDLAYGLEVPADDPIYAAARKVESATKEMGVVTGASYDDSLGQSRIIKDIQDLSEKLDLVLGS